MPRDVEDVAEALRRDQADLGPAVLEDDVRRDRRPVEELRDLLRLDAGFVVVSHDRAFLDRTVNRIVELEPDKRVVGLKNVTINEQFVQGHFPGAPVMPGVLILEAMAQVAGILIYRDMPEPDRATKLIYFTGIENAKFRRPVVPGDQLRIEMDVLSRRSSGSFGKVAGRAMVDGKLVAEAVVVFAISERPGS